jgi:hypothetical protein
MKSNPGMRSGLNSGHRNYPVYKCNREDPRTRKQLCPAPRVRCDLIEPVAFDAIWGMVTQPKRLLAQGWTFFKSREKSGSAVTKLETESTRLERSIAGLQLMIDKGAGDAAKAIESILGKQRRLAEIAGELRDAGRVVDLPTERQVEAAQRRIVDPRTKDRLTFADKRSILECVQDLRMEYYDGDLTITGAVPMPAANKCNPTQDHGYTYLTTIPFEIKLKVGA